MSILFVLAGLGLTHYKVARADRLSVYLAGVSLGFVVGVVVGALT